MHIILALRNPETTLEVTQKWQNEMFGPRAQLNVDVMEVDLLTIVRVAKAWNANLAPMLVLIDCVQKSKRLCATVK